MNSFSNDKDAFIPEIWAQEGLVILEENMVAANLVHRDFEDEIKNFGDVVNTRRPGNFKINRKIDGSTLVQQGANATNVQVPLDQWFYNSFIINDGEISRQLASRSKSRSTCTCCRRCRPSPVALIVPSSAGSNGSFNWAFHREAPRSGHSPLALPNERMGVMATQCGHRCSTTPDWRNRRESRHPHGVIRGHLILAGLGSFSIFPLFCMSSGPSYGSKRPRLPQQKD